MSIDTEGSEFEILSTLDFSKYNISLITCEHNYSSKRKIFSLLSKHDIIEFLKDLDGMIGMLRKSQKIKIYMN